MDSKSTALRDLVTLRLRDGMDVLVTAWSAEMDHTTLRKNTEDHLFERRYSTPRGVYSRMR